MTTEMTCTWCGRTVTSFCPDCTEELKHRPDPEAMTPAEREAEMRWFCEGPGQYLFTPFDLVHARIEALVGRPVWTHEMGRAFPALVAEAKHRQHPSMQGVLDKIPSDKTIIVVE